MGKIVKGIVLGAAAGAGIRLVQDLRSTEDDLGTIASRVAKTAGEAALAGAAVGVVLTARDRRRRRKLARRSNVEKLRSLAETSLQVAVPTLHQAAGVTRERAVHAAEVARPQVEHAIEVARPRVEAAAKEARKRAEQAADAARPRVESAAKEARKRAEAARPHVEAAAKEARDRATSVADLAAERTRRKLADLDLPATIIAV